jgi:sodium-dependent dicarboxylate transporter 2/3/5
MNKIKLSNFVIGSIVSVGFYAIPFNGISEPSHRCLAIFAWAIWMWISEAIPLYITSLAILLLEAVFLAPVLDIPIDSFFAPFFSNVIALFMGGLVLAATLQKYRADEYLAHRVLSRVGRKPQNILLGIIATTAFISLWISNTATTAMMMAIALSVARNLGATDPIRKAMILGVPIAACIGGIGTPVGTPPNLIALQYLDQIGIEISFVKWIALVIPVLLILIIALWRILLTFFPPDCDSISLPKADTTRLSAQQISVLGIFAATLLLWMTESLHGLRSGLVGLIPVIAIFGVNLLNRGDFRKIEWDILFLLGGGLTLGFALDRSGLSVWLVGQLNLSAMPTYALALIVAVVTILFSTFISHTSAANILIPMTVTLKPEAGSMVCFMAGLAVSFGLALPISSPSNAIAYGTGELKTGDMVKTGIAVGLVALILFASIGYFWWRFLKI